MKREENNIVVVRSSDKKVDVSFKNIQSLSGQSVENIRNRLINFVTRKNYEIVINLSGIKMIESVVFDNLNLLSRMAKRYNSIICLTHIEVELLEIIELIKDYLVFDLKIVKKDIESRNVA